MYLQILKDASGNIIAAHPDKALIQELFFRMEGPLEIWILQTSDVLGLVETLKLLISKN